jgi:hypothetical protein
MEGPIAYNHALSAAVGSPKPFLVGEFDAGTILHCTARTEAATGTPSSISITPSFAVAPIIHRGLNLSSETSGIPKPWFACGYATDVFKASLLDGDWKVFTTVAGGDMDYRRFVVPAGFNLVRVVFTFALTGGTAPVVPIYLDVSPS